jgi:hypothetical protein
VVRDANGVQPVFLCVLQDPPGILPGVGLTGGQIGVNVEIMIDPVLHNDTSPFVFKFQIVVLFGLKFVAPMGRQRP